jgi:hypothetical protein
MFFSGGNLWPKFPELAELIVLLAARKEEKK